MPNRHFSIEQIEAICHILIKKYNIIIGEKTMLENIKEIKKVTFFNSSCILDTIPLIKNSDLIISVDTSIVHIATCFAKKAISFYLDTSIKKPIQDDVKGCYNFNLHLLKSTLEDKFHDGKYLRKNNPDKTIPINHKVWAPNNKNCIQLIFDYDEIRNIPIDELSVTTTNSLLKIAY
jgi:ADP-heptose:LPS heptosyltransferase